MYLDQIANEIRGQIPAASLPEGDTRLLFRLYALLTVAKGDSVTAGDVHDAWALWMQEVDPGHEAIKPFDQLSRETQAQDEPFVEAIRRAAKARA